MQDYGRSSHSCSCNKFPNQPTYIVCDGTHVRRFKLRLVHIVGLRGVTLQDQISTIGRFSIRFVICDSHQKARVDVNPRLVRPSAHACNQAGDVTSVHPSQKRGRTTATGVADGQPVSSSILGARVPPSVAELKSGPLGTRLLAGYNPRPAPSSPIYWCLAAKNGGDPIN